MHAIILAGGFGTRLQPVVPDRPKPMAEIDGRPFLEYLILQLRGQGLRDIVLSVGHMADLIENHFGDGGRLGVSITYSREERPLGTAGATKLAASAKLATSATPGERWLVLNGDSIFDIRFDRLLSGHSERKAAATIALARVDDAARYGNVALDAEDRVTAFTEKGDSSAGDPLINAGIYVLERDAIEQIPADRAVSLEREVFPTLVGDGLYGVPLDGAFVDIGVPDDYARLRADPGWLRRLTG